MSGVAAAGDYLAGDVDEEVAQNVEAYDAGADVLAGSTDEAFHRARSAALRGDVVGYADHMSGNIDEAVVRTADHVRRGETREAVDDATGRLDRTAEQVVDATPAWADALAGSTDEATHRAVSSAAEGDLAGVADAAAGRFDESLAGVGPAVEEQVERAPEIYSEAADEATAGNFEAAAETLYAGAAESGDRLSGRFDESADRIVTGFTETDTAYEYAALLGDELAGHVDEQFGGKASRRVSDELTIGSGYLTEDEEADLADAAGEYGRDVEATADLVGGATGTVWGDERVGKFTEGTVAGVGHLTNVFAGAGAAETGAEIGGNAPELFDEGGAAAVTATAGYYGARATESMYQEATTNPYRFAGEIGGELAVGYGVARATGISGPVRYERADLPTTEGMRTYRGITTKAPWRDYPTPRVGATGMRPTAGTPDVELQGPRMAPNTEGAAPTTPLETTIWDKNLRQELEGKDLRRYEASRELAERMGDRRFTSRAADRVPGGTKRRAEEAIAEAEQIPEDAAPEIAAWMRDDDAIFGGSAAQLTHVDRARTPQDIDIYTSDPRAAEGRLYDILREYEDRPMRQSGPGRKPQISVRTDQGWQHMVDINPRERATGRKDFGGKLYGGTTGRDRVDVQTLEGQVSGKLEGAARLYGTGTIAPKSYRPKDVFDLGLIGRETAKTQRRSLNPFERRRASGTEDLVEEYQAAWGDLDLPGGHYSTFDDLADSFDTTEFDTPTRFDDVTRGIDRRTQPFQEFVEDTRGQAGFGGGRRGRMDVDVDEPSARARGGDVDPDAPDRSTRPRGDTDADRPRRYDYDVGDTPEPRPVVPYAPYGDSGSDFEGPYGPAYDGSVYPPPYGGYGDVDYGPAGGGDGGGDYAPPEYSPNRITITGGYPPAEPPPDGPQRIMGYEPTVGPPTGGGGAGGGGGIPTLWPGGGGGQSTPDVEPDNRYVEPEPMPEVSPYDIPYRNPIASGAEVLFGGAYPEAQPASVLPDEGSLPPE